MCKAGLSKAVVVRLGADGRRLPSARGCRLHGELLVFDTSVPELSTADGRHGTVHLRELQRRGSAQRSSLHCIGKKGEGRRSFGRAAGLLGVAMQREEGCHGGHSRRNRDFIIAPYYLDEAGGWIAERPATAPCGPGCDIREHGSRERKTGPGHPLLVIRCVVHNRSFTIYPPGFTPYGRRRLVPRHQRWAATIFEAVLDASEGERWSDTGQQGGWWSTQWRHLERLGELLGLGGGDRVGERVAQVLGVALHVHIEARTAFGIGGFHRRGRAVRKVLKAVRDAGGDVLRRLLRAGYAAGQWGRGFWADPRWGLRPVVFGLHEFATAQGG